MAARKPLTRTSGRVTELLAADNIDAGSKKITSVANGSAAQDAAAFGQLPTLPLTTDGDLLTRASSANARLAIGATAASLQVVSGLPAWVANQIPFQSGRDYYTQLFGDRVTNGVALTANKAYAMPIYVPPGAPNLVGFAIRSSANVNATHARMALYNDNGSFAPGTLFKDGGAVTFNGANGRFASSFTGIALPPGLYWTALVTDGTPTVRGFAGSTEPNMIPLGADTNINAAIGYIGGYDTFTYGAWADPYGTYTLTSMATIGSWAYVFLVF